MSAITLLADDSATNITMTVSQPGIYKAVIVEQKADASLTIGHRSLVKDIQIVTETHQIPATIGVMFGFRYRIQGKQQGEKIEIKTIIIYPGDGIQSSGESKPHKSDSYTHETTASDLHAEGFTFENQYELLTGDWTIQQWYGNKKLAEEKFTVVKANQ